LANRTPIEVAAALVFRDGKLLIAQRFQEAHLGGMWEFPGGKREPGETWSACLARELQEELGIEVEVGSLVDEVVHDYPEKSIHLRFFACKWLRHEPRAIGCPDFRWISRAELDNFAYPAADDTLVRKLKTTPSLWETQG